VRKYALIIMLVLVVASTTWANLLSNPGFESGATDWTGAGSRSVETWAPRTGNNGLAFQGWNWAPANWANIAQEVAVVTNGEYTFSIWVKGEVNFNFQTNTLKLEWYDSSHAALQDATIKAQSVPSDSFWHRIYISGSCASNNLAYVKASIDTSWGDMPEDPRSCMLDDAVLVTGTLVNTGYQLSNGGFEAGQVDSWGGTQWAVNTNSGINRAGWAARSGSNGVVLEGWTAVETVRLSQPVYPENTGTFTYSFWARAETNFFLTNAEIRLEWYDETLTNEVQAATVQPFAMPPEDGSTWYQYSITGTCAQVALYEIRPIISMQWELTSGDQQAGRLDDCLMTAGTYINPPLDMDWAYYSGLGYNPLTEQVPNTNVGAFMQINYATTTTTFYVLGNEPSQCANYPAEQNSWEFKTSYNRPDHTDTWWTEWFQMEKVGDIELAVGDFHSLPASGVQTVGLWKTEWTQPLSTNGGVMTPYTEGIRVYYVPFTKSTNGSTQTDFNYLLAKGDATNNLDQTYGQDTTDKDYFYQNARPAPLGAFTNGGFESPVSTTNDYADTGWRASGGAARETWASQSGFRGAAFPAWFSENTEEYSVFQDVATTSETNTFSVWVLAEGGVSPTTFELRMEWYDSNLNLLEVDTQSILTMPLDGGWHPAYITGVCTSNDIASVRIATHGLFDPSTGNPSAVLFDNAEFYAGEFVPAPYLVNGSFEDAIGLSDWRGSSWYTIPDRSDDASGAARKDWAARSGTSGVAMICFDTNHPGTNYTMYVAQSVTPEPGTNTFSLWMFAEDNADLTCAELRMEWFDSDYNHIQPTITNDILATMSNWWKRFDLTGTCTSNELFELRVGLYTEWSPVTNDVPSRSIKVDDMHLVSGALPYTEIGYDWAYYNAGPVLPETEEVPGTNVGEFIQIDYSSTTTVFYALADGAGYTPAEDEVISMGFRYYYYNPATTLGISSNVDMVALGDVDITSAAPFHGLPAAGSQSLSLWKFDFTQPLDAVGVPVTNAIEIFYSSFLKRVYNGVETNNLYLARDTVEAPYTNNYTVNPQLLSTTSFDTDYTYTNVFLIAPTHDGIPNSWWLQYWTNNPPTNAASADNDGDLADNLEEYIADTVPTNAASVYVSQVTNLVGSGVTMVLLAGPPTSPNREYDVWYKTNLVEESPWIPYGLDMPGIDAATPVSLTVTNDLGSVLYYRSGVRLP